ncbi:hypothetical protein GCM10027446_18750 [Angustibacter peucedani]
MDMERSTAMPSGGTDTLPVTCATCGATAPDDGTWRLTWSTGVEHGRSVHTCDRCARDNLRGIEAKLDSEWW